MTTRPDSTHVHILRDLVEEGWTSMELYADMLESKLADRPQLRVTATTPRYVRVPGGDSGVSRNIARAVSRYLAYPATLTPRPPADIYHIADHSYAHLLLWLPPERTVVTCHDTDILRTARDPSAPAATRAVCKLVALGFRKARHIVAVSETTRQRLVEEEGVPPASITLARLGSLPCFGPIAEDSEADDLRRRHSLPGRFLLHVGSSVPRKNLPALLEAVSRTVSGVPLVQVGADPAAIRSLAASNRCQNEQVLPLGKVSEPDLAALYRQATAVILPSITEGFGLPALEAMASGTAVIASDIPAFREVVGGAGILFPCRDTHQLTACIERVSNDPALVATLRARSLERARVFSWDAMADQVAELYASIRASG